MAAQDHHRRAGLHGRLRPATLAAHLASLAVNKAAELGPLPVEHTADALRYRITTLIRKEDEMARHEALAMTRRPLPPPPTSHRPDPGRSRGISI